MQPQGVGLEAYLDGTSQGPTPEDAWEDGHIRGRSKPFMKHPGSGRTKMGTGKLYAKNRQRHYNNILIS
jgi:hypothetical protein